MSDPNALPLVALHAVSMTSEGRTRLGPIELEIRPHEIWQIHGAAGSGKTTLLELVLGRHHLSAGRRSYPAFVARFADAAIGIPPRFALRLVSSEEQRRLAVSQATFYQARWHTQWTEPLTVDEFLEPARVLGLRAFEVLDHLPVRRDYVEERELCLDAMNLLHRRDRAVGQLSNGELRKLLLIAAHLAAPDLLLLDCPLGGLDPEARRLAKREILRWCYDGQTLIFCSTHDDDLDDIATNHLALVQGRQQPDARPRPTLVAAVGKTAIRQEHERVAAPASASRSANQQSPLVSCRGVRVTAYDQVILDGIDWDVFANEHWIVTGPNGAGKTTLLALILGDHPQAYSNEVLVAGKRLGRDATLWDRRQLIGYVAPELSWHYPLGWTTEQVVLSGFDSSIGSYRTATERERAVAHDWLERLDLWRLAPNELATLSEGERRLVLLARALVRQPPLLLLDEPTQELSSDDRRRFFDQLAALAQLRLSTIILITHHFEECPPFITRHLALAQGKVVSDSVLSGS